MTQIVDVTGRTQRRSDPAVVRCWVRFLLTGPLSPLSRSRDNFGRLRRRRCYRCRVNQPLRCGFDGMCARFVVEGVRLSVVAESICTLGWSLSDDYRRIDRQDAFVDFEPDFCWKSQQVRPSFNVHFDSVVA